MEEQIHSVGGSNGSGKVQDEFDSCHKPRLALNSCAFFARYGFTVDCIVRTEKIPQQTRLNILAGRDSECDGSWNAYTVGQPRTILNHLGQPSKIDILTFSLFFDTLSFQNHHFRFIPGMGPAVW